MYLSDCCDAPAYGEGDFICSACKEHCGVYDNEDVDNDDTVVNKDIDFFEWFYLAGRVDGANCVAKNSTENLFQQRLKEFKEKYL